MRKHWAREARSHEEMPNIYLAGFKNSELTLFLTLCVLCGLCEKTESQEVSAGWSVENR
jgi:hypothetical protein